MDVIKMAKWDFISIIGMQCEQKLQGSKALGNLGDLFPSLFFTFLMSEAIRNRHFDIAPGW